MFKRIKNNLFECKNRVLSLSMAVLLTISSILLIPNVWASASNASDPVYKSNTVLFDYDLESVSGKSNPDSIISDSWDKFGYLGDLNAVKEGGVYQGYIQYCQSKMPYASLPLGYKLFYNNMINRDYWNTNAGFIPESGVTYKVEYDYKAKGTVAKDLTVGLSVGNYNYLKEPKNDLSANNLEYKADVKCTGDSTTYPTGTEFSDGNWQKAVQYITVPADTVIDKNKDRLYLTFSGGGTGSTKPYFSVDNIRVTALAPIDITYVIGSETETKRYDNRIVADNNKIDQNGNTVKWYEDPAFINAFDKNTYNFGESYVELTLYGCYEAGRFETDTVLTENDYEDSKALALGDDGRNYAQDFFNIAADVRPTNTTDKNGNATKAMRYTQIYLNYGFVIPGTDYKENNKINSSVEVKNGVTYKVEFDYKLAFETKNDGVLKDEMENDLEVGLVLMPSADKIKKFCTTSNPENVNTVLFNQANARKTPVLNISKGKTEIDWTSKTAYLTVPNDADLSEFKTLGIYILNGKRACVYIDNVKVTALAPTDVTYILPDFEKTVRYSDGAIKSYSITDANGKPAVWYEDEQLTVKFDFNAYKRTGNYTSLKLYGKYEFEKYNADTVLTENDYEDSKALALGDDGRNYAQDFFNIAADVRPTNTTDKNGNATKAMRYTQIYLNYGFVIPGTDYKENNKINSSVEVKNGVTYKVEFDYKLAFETKNDGVLKDEMENDLEVGLVLMPSADKIKKFCTTSNPENVNTVLFNQANARKTPVLNISKGKTEIDWTSKTAYLTVPNDADLSEFKTLGIYILNGKRACVYIDNVKVTALKDKEFNVTFKTNGGTLVSGTDGKYSLSQLASLPAAAINNGTFLGWYTDADLTKAFNANDYIETTQTDITLYAKWHMNGNGSVINMDDTKYWQAANGSFDDGKLDSAFIPYSDGSNNVLKYTKKYAANKEEEKNTVRGISYSTSMAYASCIGIFDADLTSKGNYKASEVVRRAAVGKTYRITFKYKVNSYDAEHSTRGIQFGVYTSYEYNQHLNRVIQNIVVSEYGTTGWKTASGYFTVEAYGKDATVPQGVVKCNAFSLGVSGYGEVLVDDISLSDWDIEKATYINFAGDGVDIAGQEFLIDSKTVLPTPVREGYTFDKWYTDAKLTKAFDAAKYKRTTGILTLYAGWVGEADATNIDFTYHDYYLSANKGRQCARLSEEFAIITENGNTYLKRKLTYTREKKDAVTEIGNCVGPYGTYPGVIGLYYPNVTRGTSWKYDDAAYKVAENEEYFISFKYKAISVDTKSSYPSRITIYSGVTKENSCHSGRQLFSPIADVSRPTDDWVTAGAYLKIPTLDKASGNRLAVMIAGYGEIMIDDIKIIKLKNAVVFDTDGGSYSAPIYGDVGKSFKMPANPTRENSKFMGWYTDTKFQNVYSATKLTKGVTRVYAKFLTYQTVQGFEDYSMGLSNGFESDNELNIKCDTNDTTVYKQWAASNYNAAGVRNGSVSVHRKGNNQYLRMFTLFDTNTPLTVGEKYVLSVWVKAKNVFMSGDVQLVYSDNKNDMRNENGWNKKQRGARTEVIGTTDLVSEYEGEWLEFKYEFTAKAKYVGLAMPGMTEFYIDDACITLATADASYKRTINGKGIKYEDWYSELEEDDDDDIFEKPTINLNNKKSRGYGRVVSGNNPISQIISEMSSLPVIAWVCIGCGILIVGGGVTALIIVKKKKKLNTL